MEKIEGLKLRDNSDGHGNIKFGIVAKLLSAITVLMILSIGSIALFAGLITYNHARRDVITIAEETANRYGSITETSI